MCIYVSEYTFQGFGSNNNSEMPLWIRTVMSVSHLMVIFNSTVNFYIYLVKLRIMHNTFLNCCNEEMKMLSRRKRDETNEMRRHWSREIHDISDHETNKTSTSGTRIPTENMALSERCPDIIQSAVVN